ncbi:MAG: sulfite exporter TauE/SafE family protein [Leptospirales bacterium]|jgi:sulfite exporter TauE/SafE
MDLFSIQSFLVLLPIGSFVAGLTSTPHCAVMCGPLFVLFGEGGPAYQIGRVLGYTTIGAIAGLLGASLNIAGEFAAIQRLSLYVVAAMFVLFGVYHLLPAHTRAKYSPDFTFLTRWLVRRLGRLRSSGAVHHPQPGRVAPVSLLAGSLSALLPCGPLIPLWMLAAGSGGAPSGALLSGGFVLGTIPGAALIAWSGGRFKNSNAPLLRKARRLAGVCLLIAGVAMLGIRSTLTPAHDNEGAPADPICHTPETLFL